MNIWESVGLAGGGGVQFCSVLKVVTDAACSIAAFGTWKPLAMAHFCPGSCQSPDHKEVATQEILEVD